MSSNQSLSDQLYLIKYTLYFINYTLIKFFLLILHLIAK